MPRVTAKLARIPTIAQVAVETMTCEATARIMRAANAPRAPYADLVLFLRDDVGEQSVYADGREHQGCDCENCNEQHVEPSWGESAFEQ